MDLWGPAGSDWLGRELLGYWSQSVENAVESAWNREDWLLRGYPWHTLAFLLREYAYGTVDSFPHTERKLRGFIWVVSDCGDRHQLVVAMVLLALVQLDTTGVSDEVHVIADYASAEFDDSDHQVGGILTLLLAARVAIVRGDVETASEHMQHLLAIPSNSSEPWVVAVLGLAYLRLAVVIWRGPSPLQTPWRMAVSSWLRVTEDTAMPLRDELASLITGLERPPSRGDVVHPLAVWIHRSMETKAVEWGTSLEYQVMQALLEAESNSQARERARYLASRLGDEFWIEATKAPGTNQLDPTEPARNSDVSRGVRVGSKWLPNLQVLNGRLPLMRFAFFGSFYGAFDHTDSPVFPPRFRRKKVKQLLALLLLQPRYGLIRDRLLEELFGDVVEDVGGNYLHVTIHRARQLLNQQAGYTFDSVLVQDNVIKLNEQCIGAIDVEEYRKRASVGHQLWPVDRQAAIELYEQAVAQYRSTVSPEFEYDEFMVALRNELEGTQRRMLRRLSEFARSHNNVEYAIHLDEQRLLLDPWDMDILYQLCQDWHKTGEVTRIRHTAKESVERLREDGEPVPAWLQAHADSKEVPR